MHVINFSSSSALKVFNAGAELELATPLATAVSVSFFLDKNYIYLDAELQPN